MKYDKAKEFLKDFDKILVSGPERSGTTIASEIIAKDFGLHPIREEFFGCTRLDSLVMIFASQESFVIQCPEIALNLHNLASINDTKKFLVVFMMRAIEDIIDSQDRLVARRWGSSLSWTEKCEANLIKRYRGLIDKDDIDFEMRDSERLPDLKYRFWKEIQELKLENTLELDYESLQEHSLWIPKEKRLEFGGRQTSEQ